MCATSATNVAQNVAQFYLYFKYKSVYVHENSPLAAQIFGPFKSSAQIGPMFTSLSTSDLKTSM